MNIYSASLSILLNTSSEIELPANSGSTECAAVCTPVSDNCVLVCILFWHLNILTLKLHSWSRVFVTSQPADIDVLFSFDRWQRSSPSFRCIQISNLRVAQFNNNTLIFFTLCIPTEPHTQMIYTLWWPDPKRGFKCKDHTKLAVSQAKKADKWQVKKKAGYKNSQKRHLQMISNNQQGTTMSGKLVRKEN